MNRDALIAKAFPDITATFTARDTMLYALGIGACLDPVDPLSLKYVYERDLEAAPSMSCVLAHPGSWFMAPELGLDWVKLLHAEQCIELQRPLPVEGTVTGRYRVTSVVDKGADRGALLYLQKSLQDADGNTLAIVRSSYFLRGDGGCGSWGEAEPALQVVPDRPADGAIDIRTQPTSALLYRLSGDYNPLHADPDIARNAGFARPILHGLCTYGSVCQSLVVALCGGDGKTLKSMAARFTSPVFPGETLRTEWWKSDEGWFRFRSNSVERGIVVLDRGTVQLRASVA